MDWKWSPAEKIVARRAFDLALNREFVSLIREAKERAERIGEVSALWELEGWLGARHREIDSLYDYRYSVLPILFASLIKRQKLLEADLSGLSEAKLAAIRAILSHQIL